MIVDLPSTDTSAVNRKLVELRESAGAVALGRVLLALQGSAGSFEGAVDRFDGHLQHVGHFAGVESEDVAQDQDGELARR